MADGSRVFICTLRRHKGLRYCEGKVRTTELYDTVRIVMGDVKSDQPPAGRPRDPRLDAAIIDATVTILTECGYNEMSLAAVADRAETTTAAIYRRYGSKSELVTKAVFRTDGDDVVADTGDLEADLATMIRWSVEKLQRPAALAAIIGLLGESKSERKKNVVESRSATQLTAERLERAKAAGELRSDVDAELLASLIDGPVLHVVLGGMATPIDDAWIAQLVQVVLNGARADAPRTVPTIRHPKSRTHTTPKTRKVTSL